jgi:hypothetical protein
MAPAAAAQERPPVEVGPPEAPLHAEVNSVGAINTGFSLPEGWRVDGGGKDRPDGRGTTHFTARDSRGQCEATYDLIKEGHVAGEKEISLLSNERLHHPTVRWSRRETRGDKLLDLGQTENGRSIGLAVVPLSGSAAYTGLFHFACAPGVDANPVMRAIVDSARWIPPAHGWRATAAPWSFWSGGSEWSWGDDGNGFKAFGLTSGFVLFGRAEQILVAGGTAAHGADELISAWKERSNAEVELSPRPIKLNVAGREEKGTVFRVRLAGGRRIEEIFLPSPTGNRIIAASAPGSTLAAGADEVVLVRPALATFLRDSLRAPGMELPFASLDRPRVSVFQECGAAFDPHADDSRKALEHEEEDLYFGAYRRKHRGLSEEEARRRFDKETFTTVGTMRIRSRVLLPSQLDTEEERRKAAELTDKQLEATRRQLEQSRACKDKVEGLKIILEGSKR